MSGPSFHLGELDHVAIRVKDIDRSIIWYKYVLGLRAVRAKKWGNFPIFLLSGKTGIALFPEKESGHEERSRSDIDHFAFVVTNHAFNEARAHYEAIGIPYVFKDHHYFHSIYTDDPDGHTVELTTLIRDGEVFYGAENL